MTYIVAIVTLAFCHLLFQIAKRGRQVPSLLEKASVFVAAISSLVAIIDLCGALLSRFDQRGGAFAGWMPEVVAYPLGLIMFLIVVFVVLPNPINRNKQAEQIGPDQPPTRSEFE